MAGLTAKDVGLTVTEQSEQTSAAMTDDSAHLAAAEYVGRRIREIAGEQELTLTQAFNRYIDSMRHTMNYETFQIIMMEAIKTSRDSLNRIVRTFAGALRISEAVYETGNDKNLQNQYRDMFARFVGKFINDQGLRSWVEHQGGWVS